VGRVDRRDHQQSAEVVDDGEAEEEHAQPRRRTGREQRQRAEGESGVGRHRGAPAATAGTARVEHQVDSDRDSHPADRGEDGDRQPPAVPQLAQVELALGLEPDDKEEERHQTLVDPMAQVSRDSGAADADREPCGPERLV